MYNCVMENDFCNKCGECCKKIKADFDLKILYWDKKQPLTDEFAEMLIPSDEENTYFCKYLKDNLCTNPNKPDICHNYPSSAFVKLPEDCGYNGFIFIQTEKIKQKIRKLKEEILHYEMLIKVTKEKREQNQLQKIINSHQKYIDKYKEFGSENW